jgi:hypothetical protein
VKPPSLDPIRTITLAGWPLDAALPRLKTDDARSDDLLVVCGPGYAAPWRLAQKVL